MYRFSTTAKRCRDSCLTEGLNGLAQGVDYHRKQLGWLQNPNPDRFFEHLELRLKLLELYRDFFPRHWQQSDASSVVVDWERHTPKELEFFDCIDEFRFPYERDSEDFQHYLEVAAFNPDLSEEAWEDVGCLAHCYMGLCGYADWEQVINHYNLQDSDIDTPLPCERLNNEQVEKHCQQQQSPLKALSTAFKVIEHCTGNVWIDGSHMDPSYLHWSHETIESLTTDCVAAQELNHSYYALDTWLTEAPERISTVVKLWNAACIDSEDPGHRQLELPLVTTISSTEFVAGTWQQEFQATRQHYQQLSGVG